VWPLLAIFHVIFNPYDSAPIVVESHGLTSRRSRYLFIKQFLEGKGWQGHPNLFSGRHMSEGSNDHETIIIIPRRNILSFWGVVTGTRMQFFPHKWTKTLGCAGKDLIGMFLPMDSLLGDLQSEPRQTLTLTVSDWVREPIHRISLEIYSETRYSWFAHSNVSFPPQVATKSESDVFWGV
jgi:hypothetical protein